MFLKNASKTFTLWKINYNLIFGETKTAPSVLRNILQFKVLKYFRFQKPDIQTCGKRETNVHNSRGFGSSQQFRGQFSTVIHYTDCLESENPPGSK